MSVHTHHCPSLLLEGRVAIVTGARRVNGIGFATALRLGLLGARVIVTDIAAGHHDRQLDACLEILRTRGIEAQALLMDITDYAQVDLQFQKIFNSLGRIDIIVNNAGSAGGTGPFETIALTDWENTIRVNLFGIVHTVRAALPIMRLQHRGSIINNASIAGLGAIPLLAAYTASKFAVVGLTKALACELGPHDIRVNAVCPGLVWTDMGRYELSLLGDPGLPEPEAKDALARSVPLGRRWASPAEIADVIAFLASDQSRYVTGAIIPVAGGLAPGL